MDSRVRYLTAFGRDEEALAAAAPILTGQRKCLEVPHRTYSRVLLPLLRLGRPAEAMSCHRKGYRLIVRNPGFVRQIGKHLLFLALTDNLANGLTLLERHLPTALVVVSAADRFEFFLGARFLLERLAEQGKDSLKLRPPPTFPPPTVRGRYATAELCAWFLGRLTDLAARFDARNGNDFMSRRVAGLAELKRLETPYPLSSRRAAEDGLES